MRRAPAVAGTVGVVAVVAAGARRPVLSPVVTDEPYTAAQIRLVTRVARAAVRRVVGRQPWSVGYDADTRSVEVRTSVDVDVVATAAGMQDHLRRHLGADVPVPDVRIRTQPPVRRG